MHAYRQTAAETGWSASEIQRAISESGHPWPRVRFAPEVDDCLLCGCRLRIQKSQRRRVITLAHGCIEAVVIRGVCGQGHVTGPAALRRLVPPGQRYGYDLIVEVGVRRYLKTQQREEIRRDLREQYGIELSTGTVSTLCDRFLRLFEALHCRQAPALRRLQQGGYPMHLDATCDKGRGGVCVCLDGWHGWVLWAQRVDSEAGERMAPVVAKTLELFGPPIATMRDMGRGPANAVRPLCEQGTPDLICHYHFLAAVGKQLLDQPHRHLMGQLRSKGLRSKLRTLLKDLKAYDHSQHGRFGHGHIRQSLSTLVGWVLEGHKSTQAPFPFALPYLELVRRTRLALETAEAWVPRPRTKPEYGALRHLSYFMPALERDGRLAPLIELLEERWRWFSELRDLLRLTQADRPHGQAPVSTQELPAFEWLQLQQIEKAVAAYRAELKATLPAEDKEARRPSSAQGIILNALDRHGAHLFGHPVRRDAQGHILCVVDRTNNILEQLFGQQKRSLRRRVGRAHLARDLELQPAQVFLVENLHSPTYLRTLCGSLDNLPAAFADIDRQRAPAPMLRDHRGRDLQLQIKKLLNTPDAAVSSPPARSGSTDDPANAHRRRQNGCNRMGNNKLGEGTPRRRGSESRSERAPVMAT